MWEVWEVMLMTQIQVLQAFDNLTRTYAAEHDWAWPPGFAVFGSDTEAEEPLTTRLYLSPAATELTKGWPANSFTRCGFTETIPTPYASVVSDGNETDPLVRQALSGQDASILAL
jgi:hypothetical protein